MLVRHSSLLFLWASAATIANAQALADLPGCGQTCIAQATDKKTALGCDDGSQACLCAKADYHNSINDCVAQSCAADLRDVVLNYITSTCAAAGAAPAATTAAPAATPTPATSAPAPAETTPSSAPPAATPSTSEVPSTSSPTPAPTAQSTTSSPVPSSSSAPSAASSSASSSSTTSAGAAATTSPSSSSSTSASSSATSAASTSTSEPAPAAAGLSTGAKVGVAVGASAGAVAVIALAACVFITRRQKQRAGPGNRSYHISDPMPGSGRDYTGWSDPEGHSSELEMKSRRYEDMLPRQTPRTMV